MDNFQEDRERRLRLLESYRDNEVVKGAGFQKVQVVTTGVGNIVDYLGRQKPEEGTCMTIYKQGEDGNLRRGSFGYPTIEGVLELVVEAYEKSDVASFVGISSNDMGNTHEGTYFRLFFRPQHSKSHHHGDEALYEGIGATKAFEIVCKGVLFNGCKSRISVNEPIKQYRGVQ